MQILFLSIRVCPYILNIFLLKNRRISTKSNPPQVLCVSKQELNKMIDFTYLEGNYRTNADASVVERQHGKTWSVSNSLAVRSAALAALKATT